MAWAIVKSIVNQPGHKFAISTAKVVRLGLRLALFGGLAVLAAISVAWLAATWLSYGRIYETEAQIPGRDVVIVPGARIFSSGEPSQMVQGRTGGAISLYEEGTVGHILVSGDNREANYNEPAVMRNTIVDRGVPSEQVTPDYAGLDTWDTCIRAAEQFGVDNAVVVTQRLHAKRTAALCRAAGIDVVVLAVEPPPQRTATKIRTRVRESLATVKALGDMVRKPPAEHGGAFVGLVGSVDMPATGHPPDWDWEANTPSDS